MCKTEFLGSNSGTCHSVCVCSAGPSAGLSLSCAPWQILPPFGDQLQHSVLTAPPPWGRSSGCHLCATLCSSISFTEVERWGHLHAFLPVWWESRVYTTLRCTAYIFRPAKSENVLEPYLFTCWKRCSPSMPGRPSTGPCTELVPVLM